METILQLWAGTYHEFPACIQNMDESIKGAQSCGEPLASPEAGKAFRAFNSSSPVNFVSQVPGLSQDKD